MRLRRKIMPTKKEMEDQLKVLKGTIKQLKSELKEVSSATNEDLGDNPERALGLFKKDGRYQIARIDYNPDTGAAEIFSVADSDKNPLSMELATFRFDETAQEEIFERFLLPVKKTSTHHYLLVTIHPQNC